MRNSQIRAPNLNHLKRAQPLHQKTDGQKPFDLWLISEILATSQPLSNATPRYFDKLLCAKPTFVMNCQDHDKR
jgi:hypothetical protein